MVNCKRVVHAEKYETHKKTHNKRRPLRVTDTSCCPPDNGLDGRNERDSALEDEDGHQAIMNDAKVGCSVGVDSQRIAAIVVAMSVAAGVLYLASKKGLLY